MAADLITCALTAAGLLFFLAGTVGIIRFPDTHSRLHALTKADNVGLGLLILGLAFQAPDVMTLGKLGLIWILALVAAGTTAQLVARSGLRKDHNRGISRLSDASRDDVTQSNERRS